MHHAAARHAEYGDWWPHDEMEAHVAEAALAINAHDSLVSALTEARRVIAMLRDEAPTNTWQEIACDMADMAVERADKALAGLPETCTWAPTGDRAVPYTTSCGHALLQDSGVPFCPYCGKRVVVAEEPKT